MNNSIIWKIKTSCSRIKSAFFYSFKVFLIYQNPWKFFMSRFEEGETTLVLKNGLKFIIRCKSGDRGAVSQIIMSNLYFEYYAPQKSDIVIDVGSNIGEFTIPAASMCSNGLVYAIEPIEESFKLFNRNIKENELKNVIGFYGALAGRDGFRDFLVTPTRVTTSMIFHQGKGEFRRVAVISLRTFLDKHNITKVDLLKMNCEGAEFEILMNSSKEVLRKINRIVLEFHNVSIHENADLLRSYLESNNFKVETTGKEWGGCLYAKRF
jgi:FkbM family methyltransferase